MRKKIFYSLFFLTFTALILAASLFLWVTYRQVSQENINGLKNQAHLMIALYRDGQLNFERLKESSILDRVTVLSPEGNVLFDNYVDAETMENHLQREEVQQALHNKEGYAVRMSDTLGKEVIYYAVLMPDGDVLRFARVNDTVLMRFASVSHYVLGILLILIAGAFFAARSITARVIKPLEKIDLNRPLIGLPLTYPELQPLLERIVTQQRKLEKEMRRYKNKKQELKAVTNNMDEGLLFLDNSGEIVSINKSAVRFFASEKQELIGKNLLTLSLGKEIEKLFAKIDTAGKGSLLLSRGSSYYQLNGSKIGDKGMVLLIMDVTEKTASEKLRREFSANVSHELKTPLQSVLGYSEIMLNGLVKEDDRPRFLRKIYDEAKNLLQLIDDIIKLSRLEEQQQDMLENFNLRKVLEQAVQRMADKASRNNIAVNLECGAAEYLMQGIPSMLEEVFANLLDNAIKYNRPGGSVTMKVIEKENKWVISVADTGIGIAPEEKDRIFERFYRIDKSRHKAVEGTGLGLSIVKHGIIFHKGTIKVLSAQGKGTEFVIKLPKTLV
jgi:two-component system phosphate regulon sensor histidine kinase PhoR